MQISSQQRAFCEKQDKKVGDVRYVHSILLSPANLESDAETLTVEGAVLVQMNHKVRQRYHSESELHFTSKRDSIESQNMTKIVHSEPKLHLIKIVTCFKTLK